MMILTDTPTLLKRAHILLVKLDSLLVAEKSAGMSAVGYSAVRQETQCWFLIIPRAYVLSRLICAKSDTCRAESKGFNRTLGFSKFHGAVEVRHCSWLQVKYHLCNIILHMPEVGYLHNHGNTTFCLFSKNLFWFDTSFKDFPGSLYLYI